MVEAGAVQDAEGVEEWGEGFGLAQNVPEEFPAHAAAQG